MATMMSMRPSMSEKDGAPSRSESASALGENQSRGNSLKKTVFTVLQVVIKEDKKPRHWVWTAGTLIIDFFQLLSFALNGGVDVNFGIVDKFSQVTDKFRLYSELAGSIGGFTAALYVSWAWVACILAALFYVFRSVKQSNVKYIFPFRFLRFSIGVSLAVLFIPIAQVLLFVLDCNYFSDPYQHYFLAMKCWDASHAIHSIISILFLFVFSALLALMTLVYFDYKPGGLMSKAHGRLDFLHLACRLCLCLNVTFFHSGGALAVLSSVVLLALSIIMTVATLYFLPYYTMLINSVKTGTYFAFFWASLCTFVSLCSGNTIPSSTLSAMVFVGVPLSFVTGFVFVRYLYIRIWTNCLRGVFWSKHHVEVATRFFYFYHYAIRTPRNQAILGSIQAASGTTGTLSLSRPSSWGSLHFQQAAQPPANPNPNPGKSQKQHAASAVAAASASASTEQTAPSAPKRSFSKFFSKLFSQKMKQIFGVSSTLDLAVITPKNVIQRSNEPGHAAASTGDQMSIKMQYLHRKAEKINKLKTAIEFGLEKLKDLLECGMIAFPDDSFLILCHALHAEISFQDPMLSIKLFSQVASSPQSKFDLAFLAHRCVEERRRGGGTVGAVAAAHTDVISQFELARDMKSLKHSHLRALNALLQFWEALSATDISVQAVEMALYNLHKWEVEAEQVFKSILRRAPGNPRLLRSYASFLIEVKHDSQKASQMLQEADEIEEAAGKATIVEGGLQASNQDQAAPSSQQPPPQHGHMVSSPSDQNFQQYAYEMYQHEQWPGAHEHHEQYNYQPYHHQPAAQQQQQQQGRAPPRSSQTVSFAPPQESSAEVAPLDPANFSLTVYQQGVPEQVTVTAAAPAKKKKSKKKHSEPAALNRDSLLRLNTLEYTDSQVSPYSGGGGYEAESLQPHGGNMSGPEQHVAHSVVSSMPNSESFDMSLAQQEEQIEIVSPREEAAELQSKSSGDTSASARSLTASIVKLQRMLELGKVSNSSLTRLQWAMKVIFAIIFIMNVVTVSTILADFSTLREYFNVWLFQESWRLGLIMTIWLFSRTITTSYAFLTGLLPSALAPKIVDLPYYIAAARVTVLKAASELEALHLKAWNYVKLTPGSHRDLFVDSAIQVSVSNLPMVTYNATIARAYNDWTYKLAPSKTYETGLLNLGNDFIKKAVGSVQLNETSPINFNAFFVRINQETVLESFRQSKMHFLSEAQGRINNIQIMQGAFLAWSFVIFVFMGIYLFLFVLPHLDREKVRVLNFIVATPRSICTMMAQRVQSAIEQEEDTSDENETHDPPPPFSETDFRQHFPAKERSLAYSRSRSQVRLILKLSALLFLLFSCFIAYCVTSMLAAEKSSVAALDLNWPIRSEIITAWAYTQELACCFGEEWCMAATDNLKKSKAKIGSLITDFIHGGDGYDGVLGRYSDIDQFLTECDPVKSTCTVPYVNSPMAGYLHIAQLYDQYISLILAENMYAVTLDFPEIAVLHFLYNTFLTQSDELFTMLISHIESAFNEYILIFSITLASAVLLLVWVYAIVQKQVVQKVGQEMCRIDLCLLLLPMEVIELMPNLKAYLVQRAKTLDAESR